MNTPPFTSAALDEIAGYMVSDRDTHRVLDRKFAEFGITEPIPEPSPEEEAYKAMGMRRGVHYGVMKPSKRDRLRYALGFQYNRSGNNGVLQLIKTLSELAQSASAAPPVSGPPTTPLGPSPQCAP